MMTTTERHLLHGIRLRNKTTTVNEVRAIEDEKPFVGAEYDTPGVPGGPTPGPVQQSLPL